MAKDSVVYRHSYCLDGFTSYNLHFQHGRLRSKFDSCRFVRFFGVIIGLDGSWQIWHLLENGGEGDHLGDFAGIAGEGVKDFLALLIIQQRAILLFKRKAGCHAPGFCL